MCLPTYVKVVTVVTEVTVVTVVTEKLFLHFSFFNIFLLKPTMAKSVNSNCDETQKLKGLQRLFSSTDNRSFKQMNFPFYLPAAALPI